MTGLAIAILFLSSSGSDKFIGQQEIRIGKEALVISDHGQLVIPRQWC